MCMFNIKTNNQKDYILMILQGFTIDYRHKYTRQQKKCPVVQISVTTTVLGRFLSIMYQIKQRIM